MCNPIAGAIFPVPGCKRFLILRKLGALPPLEHAQFTPEVFLTKSKEMLRGGLGRLKAQASKACAERAPFGKVLNRGLPAFVEIDFAQAGCNRSDFTVPNRVFVD